MGRLLVTEFVTLDGVMEAPGGEPTHVHTGWVEPFFSPDLGEFKVDETLESERLLLGRVTYESFAGAWPTYEGEMAVKMNTMPKHVVTSSTEPLAWENSHRLEGELAPAVRALVDAVDGNGAGGRQLPARPRPAARRPRRRAAPAGVPRVGRRWPPAGVPRRRRPPPLRRWTAPGRSSPAPSCSRYVR